MTGWNLGGHIAFQRPDVCGSHELSHLLVRTGSCDFGSSITASQCNKLILGRQAGPALLSLTKIPSGAPAGFP